MTASAGGTWASARGHGSLEEDLVLKHASDPAIMFPAHAYGRGGIGHFLASGQSRAGLHRLPTAAARAARLSQSTSRLTSGRSSLRDDQESCISGFSLVPTDPVSTGAAKEWEKGGVLHPSNFQSACRSVRPHDVPRGSKWCAVSYFENSPKEVKRHMAILNWIQAQHELTKAVEAQTEQARHQTWAEQQRDTFRRQRLEQAAKYTRSGMRPRSAYADLGALAAAEEAHAAAAAAAAAGSPDGLDADPMQRFYSSPSVQGVLTGMPFGPGGMGLRQRPATALPSGAHAHGSPGRSFTGSQNEFVSTLQQTGTVLRTSRTGALPLPKKTHTRVYDRMSEEAAETPMARAAALAAAQAQAQAEKEAAVLASELEALDSFEAQMRSLQRARSRVARSAGRRLSSAPEGDDDDDM